MKKRILSLTLALAMLPALLATTGLAAESHEERLQEMTKAVRAQLGVDTEFYTEFYGNLSEGVLKNYWHLNWSNPDGYSLSVRAGEAGVITYYSLSAPSYAAPYSGFFGPVFPEGEGEAPQLRDAFLARVLADGETVQVDTASPGDNGNLWSYSGGILHSGVPGPYTFRMTVRKSDGQVTHYSRTTDDQVLDDVPSATPATTAQAAAELLTPLTTFELQYIRGENGTAGLQYIPQPKDSYYVDAQTGRLVNLTELERAIREGGGLYAGADNLADAEAPLAEASDEAAVAEDIVLTETELKGAELLRDVIPAEAAFEAIQTGYPQLMLEDFLLVASSYSVVDVQEGAVRLNMTAAKEQADNGRLFRYYLTVDGKTGRLLDFSGRRDRRYDDQPLTPIGEGRAEGLARDFLAFFDPEAESQCHVSARWVPETITGYTTSYSFTFTQQVNGYPFYENHYRVSVDLETGAILALSGRFDHDVVFDSATGIVSEAQAQQGYYSAFDTQLRYIKVPFALDPARPQYQPLLRAGHAYLYRLTLAYVATAGEGQVTGVDAKTGRPVVQVYTPPQVALSYDDIDGHSAQAQIEALAALGIGYSGGSFCPAAGLTQLDWLALLMSASGKQPYDIANVAVANGLYRAAYRQGLIPYGGRDDHRVLTRAEAVKLLLDISGYGQAARLEGIYAPPYPDGADIPEAYRGYAAIAGALGLVDTAVPFAPEQAATRADGAVLLYNFMSR